MKKTQGAFEMKKFFLDHPRFRTCVIFFLIALFTLSFVQLFARTNFKYDSFSFEMRTAFAFPGGASIAIPPVGELFFHSHLTPWRLIITLDEIDFVKLRQQLNNLPPKQQWLTFFQKEVFKALLTLFTLVVLFGLAGGLAALLILRVSPRAPLFLYGLGASLVLVLLLIGGTALTYDETAIERPQYQGVLASAPWAMNLITMGIDNIEIIGDNLKKISQGLPLLYKQAGQIKAMGEFQSDLAALHVSDIHNNPAALDFIQELVTNFKVDLIIDTGDLTDYGTPLEAKLTQKIAGIKTPYLFIPGNHDSPLIIQRLRQLKQVKILENGIIKIAGLTILGAADPAAGSYNSDTADPAAMEKARASLVATYTALKTKPDLIAVHNLKLAQPLIGKAPLIIHGHDHRYRLSKVAGTIINDAGTTGSAGIRGLTPKGTPYGAAILYWKKEPAGLRLQAIDSIKINGMEGRLVIERHTF